MTHVARREYELNCNWKVFCDNYLDGGYHVPFAHPGLMQAGIDMKSYSTVLHRDGSSVQAVKGKGAGGASAGPGRGDDRPDDDDDADAAAEGEQREGRRLNNNKVRWCRLTSG